MHESSCGLKASESCNSWKGNLCCEKISEKNDFKQILAKVYTSTFPGSNFNTAYRIEYVA